jgi:hypothetical protein
MVFFLAKPFLFKAPNIGFGAGLPDGLFSDHESQFG